MDVLAQRVRCTRGKGCKLRERLCRLRRIVEVASTDQGKSSQGANDGFAQFCHEAIECGRGVGHREKGIDAVQALKEGGGQLDPVRSFSHASGTPGR